MRISEIFGLNKTQHELDFVDIDIDYDTPLFLDPYFISKNTFPIANEAQLSLRSFFHCLLSALKEDKVKIAEALFSHLGETNEICLGLSKSRPQGKGMGPSDANRIFKSLKESYAIQTGIMEDIEDFRIFVDNVDKDKMSDMTANIIKKQLIDYTQKQCKLWKIPLTSGISSGYYWDRRLNSWDNQYTDMLVIEDRKILLVPKRLVSFSTHYTPQKYLQHFILSYLQNEQLMFNGPLVQYRKDLSPYVTKKSVKEAEEKKHSINKEWYAKFTKSHPEIFKDFKLKQKNIIIPVSNTDIVYENVDEICSFLIDQLKIIKPGSQDATQYHRIIVGILELLFYPNLCSPTIEHEINDGRKRIDITFDNCANSGFFFRMPNSFNIPSQFIMVECKNYTRDIANPELDQISGRFSPNRGQIGIITCRDVEDMNLLLQRCTDTYKDCRGLIIPLIDNDIYKLLSYRAKEEYELIDNYIQQRYHEIALN